MLRRFGHDDHVSSLLAIADDAPGVTDLEAGFADHASPVVQRLGVGSVGRGEFEDPQRSVGPTDAADLRECLLGPLSRQIVEDSTRGDHALRIVGDRKPARVTGDDFGVEVGPRRVPPGEHGAVSEDDARVEHVEAGDSAIVRYRRCETDQRPAGATAHVEYTVSVLGWKSLGERVVLVLLDGPRGRDEEPTHGRATTPDACEPEARGREARQWTPTPEPQEAGQSQ